VTGPCLTCWLCCSHPHAHHTLACPSTGKDELSRGWRWLDTRFLVASQAYFSFSSPSLDFFRPAFFCLLSLSLSSLPLFSQNVPLVRFISPGRLRGCSPPQAHPAPLVHGFHDDPCTLKKGGSLSSRKIVAKEEWGAGFRARERNVCKRVCRKEKIFP